MAILRSVRATPLDRDKASVLAIRKLDAILSGLNGGVLRDKVVRDWKCGNQRFAFYFPEIRLAVDLEEKSQVASMLRQRVAENAKQAIAARAKVKYLALPSAEIHGDRDALIERLRSAWKDALTSVRAVDEERLAKARKAKPLPQKPAGTGRSSRTPKIPAAENVGWTSLSQGEKRLGDAVPPHQRRYIDEGIAGTREENRAMQGQVLQGLRERSRAK